MYIRKRWISILLCLIVSTSMHAQKKKYGFTYCFDNQNTGIEKLINIDGYYKSHEMIMRNNRMDTTFNTKMFYPNGLFVSQFGDVNRDRITYDKTKQRWLGGNIPIYFEEISKDKKNENREWFFGGIWGRYIISNDTIKVQYMQYPHVLSAKYVYESWYKVLNRNSIVWIGGMNILSNEQFKQANSDRENNPYIFHKVLIIPPYEDAWILKKKWFWCYEDDWKAFMKDRKK